MWSVESIAMREGGERIAVIRPENGFGEKGHKKAGIPPHCTFKIKICLLKCLPWYVCWEYEINRIGRSFFVKMAGVYKNFQK